MTPDVNVLVAASRSDHPHHAVARNWLQQSVANAGRGTPLKLQPMVITSFLRLVTHPKIFIHPTPMPEALRFVDALLSAPGVEQPALATEWPAMRVHRQGNRREWRSRRLACRCSDPPGRTPGQLRRRFQTPALASPVHPAGGVTWRDPWENRERTGLGADEAALALGATVTNRRFEAIRALTPRLKEGLSGQELNLILGDPRDSWRSQMVTVLAPKARAGLGGDEAALALGETQTNRRYEAIRALIPRLKEGLSGKELNLILGDPKDSWRSQMVTVLAPKARTGLSADK